LRADFHRLFDQGYLTVSPELRLVVSSRLKEEYKNVALKHGSEPNGGGLSDPWASMFGAAEECRPTGSTEIWPFWVYPVEGGAKIERHVPAMALSRDVARLERVRKMSGLYRMVFCQVRQEDLLTCLARLDASDCSRSLLIDLHP
jgi:hypothetical protein